MMKILGNGNAFIYNKDRAMACVVIMVFGVGGADTSF
jgi:hypothetical protein